MKIKEVVYDDEVNLVYQPIVRVGKTSLKVASRNRKEYWVKMSDKVAMTLNPEVKDTAVIKTFPKKWLVVDIIKNNNSESN